MKKIFPLSAALVFALLTLRAGAAADGARAGLTLSFRTAIPALFPFFITGSLLIDSGLAAALGRVLARPLYALYGVGGAGVAALLLGLTGGYPVGVRTACDLYRSGSLSRTDAEQMLGFCNNTGPAFIIGVAGIGVCGSAQTGAALYCIHVLSALLAGLLMTQGGKEGLAPPPPRRVTELESASAAFVRAVTGALSTSLVVAAFVTCFSVALALLGTFGVWRVLDAAATPLLNALGLPTQMLSVACAGLLELTNGLLQLPALSLHRRVLLPLLSFLLAFGGLSVYCQARALTTAAALSAHRLFSGKLLHAAFAALLTVLWLRAAPRSLPVFASNFQLSPNGLWQSTEILAAGGLLIISLCIALKNTGKPR